MLSARLRARRQIDHAHARAAGSPDPVAYIRGWLAEVEAFYATTGDRESLEILRQTEHLTQTQTGTP